MTIFFDNDKQAFAFKIENPICTVDDETWAKYAGSDKWDIVDGKFTDITGTDDYLKKLAADRQSGFESEFFKTSLGWIRKKVTMQDGSTKDFLFDCFPLLKAEITNDCLPANAFLYYDLPDFTKDLTADYMKTLQHINVALTADETTTFITECGAEIKKEFFGTV